MSNRIVYEGEELLNEALEVFLEVYRRSGSKDYWLSDKFQDTIRRLRSRIHDQELLVDVQTQNFATLAGRYRELATERGPRGLWRRLVQAFTS